MPRNFNTAPSASPQEDDSWRVMQEAQIDGVYENETNQEAQEQSPEDSIDSASERVSLVAEGAQTIENVKAKYGEQFENIKETAKTKLRGIGRATGAFAKKAGLFVVGAGVVGISAGIAVAGRARQSMQDRKARRQAVIEKRLEQARTEQTQADAYASYESNIAYSQSHEEALEENTSRKQSQEDAFASYQENIDFSQAREAQDDAFASYQENIDYTNAHEEALEENEQFDAVQAEKRAAYELRVAARYAQFAAYQRRDARRQKYEALRGRGSEILTSAKGKARSFGRAIARFTSRTVNAATSGARAARTNWQETAA